MKLLFFTFLLLTLNKCEFNQENNKKCLDIKHDLSQFTKINDVTGEYSLDKEKLKNNNAINKIECKSFKLNENFYEFQEPFYEIFVYHFNNYKVTGYYHEGYSDIVKAVFFNLVTYNIRNEIIDCLILDSRYKFEIEYFKKVDVTDNCEIEILDFQNKKLINKHYFKILNNGYFEEVLK